MKEPEICIAARDDFAVALKHKAQNLMRGGVLRPKVDGESWKCSFALSVPRAADANMHRNQSFRAPAVPQMEPSARLGNLGSMMPLADGVR